MKAPETDIIGLPQISLGQGTDNATYTYLFFGNTTDPALKLYLTECIDDCYMVMEPFIEAFRYFDITGPYND